jgi:hypothetical protein
LYLGLWAAALAALVPGVIVFNSQPRAWVANWWWSLIGLIIAFAVLSIGWRIWKRTWKFWLKVAFSALFIGLGSAFFGAHLGFGLIVLPEVRRACLYQNQNQNNNHNSLIQYD